MKAGPPPRRATDPKCPFRVGSFSRDPVEVLGLCRCRVWGGVLSGTELAARVLTPRRPDIDSKAKLLRGLSLRARPAVGGPTLRVTRAIAACAPGSGGPTLRVTRALAACAPGCGGPTLRVTRCYRCVRARLLVANLEGYAGYRCVRARLWGAKLEGYAGLSLREFRDLHCDV